MDGIVARARGLRAWPYGGKEPSITNNIDGLVYEGLLTRAGDEPVSGGDY